MRVQLNKFLVGIVLVLFCGTTLCAQDPELVHHYDYDKAAPINLKKLKPLSEKVIAAIPDLYQRPRPTN